MRRRVAAGLGVALAVAGIIAAVVAIAGDENEPPSRRDARAACTNATRFERLVEKDASIDAAKRALASAVAAATRAADVDPQWLSLKSGLETLVVALDHDDAGSASTGLRLVRSECARVS